MVPPPSTPNSRTSPTECEAVNPPPPSSITFSPPTVSMIGTSSPCQVPLPMDSIQVLPSFLHPSGLMSPVMTTGFPPPIPLPAMGVPCVRYPPLPQMVAPFPQLTHNGEQTLKTGLPQHVQMYPPIPEASPEYLISGPLPSTQNKKKQRKNNFDFSF